eukprot:s3212_g17.t2
MCWHLTREAYYNFVVEVVPYQDDHEAVKFLTKRHFLTQTGVIISPHEKYAEELVALYGLQHPKAKTTPNVSGEIYDSPELDEAGQHRFRSAMWTLPCLSQDRINLQHSVRHLSQCMLKPTLAAEAAVKHVILNLKETPDLGILLSYGMSNKSKLSEIHGKADPEELTMDLVGVFTDADWAGDKSSGVRRRHSVSSAMVCINGTLVTAWSRTQKSIALSSCESEYLASVGGGAEALFIASLWEFLTGKATEAHIVSDSSSCRACAQRQGVGRLKHINVKYLWLQQKIKECALQMDGVPTTLNVADLGTKRRSRARRAFLMFLIGLVGYDPNIKGYAPCGGDEFNQYIQKKALGKTMKSIRQVMVSSLVNNDAELPIRISKPLVKAMTIMALQPVVNGARSEEVEGLVVQHYNLVEVFFNFPWFMIFYALTFLLVGVFFGLHLKKVAHKIELTKVPHWAADAISKEKKEITFVDDWDPMNHELRQYRVLPSVDDAESGEEYFRECPGGLARFVKLDRKRRRRYGFKETDPVSVYDLYSGEEAEEEPMEVDELMEADSSARIARGQVYGPGSVDAPAGAPDHGGGGAHSDSNTLEYLSSLPGSPPTDVEPPPLPIIGIDWDDIDEIYRHLPVNQCERAKRVQQEPRRVLADDGSHVMVFTDACYERDARDLPCGLGGVFVDPISGRKEFFSCPLDAEKRSLLGEQSKKQIIFEAESLCAVLAYMLWSQSLEHRKSFLYVDNEGTKFSLINGASENAFVDVLSQIFAENEMLVKTSCWISRVSSHSNIADSPSRGDTRQLLQLGFNDISMQAFAMLEQLLGLEFWRRVRSAALLKHGFASNIAAVEADATDSSHGLVPCGGNLWVWESYVMFLLSSEQVPVCWLWAVLQWGLRRQMPRWICFLQYWQCFFVHLFQN